MDIDLVTDKIVQIMKEKDQSNIFKDKKVLNVKYIPKKLLYRDNEIDQLINRISSTDDVKRNISITGPVGSGKTATVLYLFHAFEKLDNFKTIYINCSSYPTYATSMGNILSDLNPNRKVSYSGWSRAMYLMRIIQEVSKYDSVVICLDEVDKLLANTGNDSVIWNLTEIENVSLVMISNVTNWYRDLDSRIKSRL